VGNSPGDPSGTPLANYEVDGTDLIGVRDNTKLGQPFDPAPIDYNWDINRDEAVDGVDLILVRDNQVDFFSSLLVLNIAAPAPAPLAEGAPLDVALTSLPAVSTVEPVEATVLPPREPAVLNSPAGRLQRAAAAPLIDSIYSDLGSRHAASDPTEPTPSGEVLLLEPLESRIFSW